MFCKECGHPIGEGEQFCGSCGAPTAGVPAQPAPQQPYAQPAVPQQPAAQQQYAFQPDAQQYAAPAYDQQQNAAPAYGQQPYYGAPAPVKKKPNWKKIGIIGGAVAACIGIFFIIAFATGMFKSTEDKMRDVTKSAVKNVLSMYTDTIKGATGSDELGSFSLELEPGEGLTTVASSQGLDLAWLKSVKVDCATNTENGKTSVSLGLSLNGTEIGVVNALIDPQLGQVLMGIDGLSNAICKTPINMRSISAMPDLDMDLLIDIIEDYLDCILDAVDTVETADGTITANGVTGNCTVYTIKIDQKLVMKISKAVLNKAISDGDLKKFMEMIYPAIAESNGSSEGFDEFYEKYFVKYLQQALTSMEQMEGQVTDEVLATITEYVYDGTLVGLRVSGSESYGSAFDLFVGLAINNGQFGMEASYNGMSILKGSGTVDGSKLSGNLQFEYQSRPLVNIKLIGWDYKDAEGSLEISLTQDAVRYMGADSQMSSILSGAALRINIDSSSLSADIVVMGQSMLKVTLAKSGRSVSAIDPGTATVDSSQWLNTFDFNALKSRLISAGVPETMINQLLSSVSH